MPPGPESQLTRARQTASVHLHPWHPASSPGLRRRFHSSTDLSGCRALAGIHTHSLTLKTTSLGLVLAREPLHEGPVTLCLPLPHTPPPTASASACLRPFAPAVPSTRNFLKAPFPRHPLPVPHFIFFKTYHSLNDVPLGCCMPSVSH